MPNTPVPPTTLAISSAGGTFVTDPGVSWFTITKRGILGGTNRINFVRNRWDINSRVQADEGLSGVEAAANLAPKVSLLERSVRDYCDISFSIGADSQLLSTQCVSGTHVAQFMLIPGYDGVRGSGAEDVLRRTFKLSVYGDQIVTSSDTLITQYRDSLRARGSGLGKTVPVGSIGGTVQPQQLSNFTPFWVTQSGFAEGLLNYPTPPTPQFYYVPNVFYLPESLEIQRYTPKAWGINQNTGFGIRWNFIAWSAYALLGNPQTF